MSDLNAMLATHAARLAQQPWLERSLFVLQDVQLLQRGEQWLLRDASQHVLPLSAAVQSQIWYWLALSGGQPCTLALEWDGRFALPLACHAAQTWYGLPLEET